jgi:hypothetical protein
VFDCFFKFEAEAAKSSGQGEVSLTGLPAAVILVEVF